MEDNNKRKYLSMLGLITISFFIIGASYAYFAVSTTNNFGTHTISGTMESIGSVALTSTGNNIALNLSAADMMQGNDDIMYFGSTDGTPLSESDWPDPVIKLADAIVTGPGTYNCNYTMQITAAGTNNMYTAFQGMSGKSNEQIIFAIGDQGFMTGDSDNGNFYDFNTANLFPITYNGQTGYISSSSPGGIYGTLAVTNKSSVNQTALAGTDITMTVTVTSFTCTALQTSYQYWNTNYSDDRYNNNQTLVSNNYPYYIKTFVIGSEDISGELCGVIGSTEVCVKPDDSDNVATYKSTFEAAGATCNSNYASIGRLTCTINGLEFNMYSTGLIEFDHSTGFCSNSGSNFECLTAQD